MSDSNVKPTGQAYAELQRAFDYYNDKLFGGQLPDCLITFQRQNNTMAYFSPHRFVSVKADKKVDEIAMNPAYFPSYPLIEVMQSMVHEMCHQWQEYFGKPSVRTYHNREWADKMIEVGLMPTSTGTVGGNQVGQKISDYPIPNGLFQRVTLELFKAGFVISWLDRFPNIVTPSHDLTDVIASWRETLASCSDSGEVNDVDEQLVAMALIAPVQAQTNEETTTFAEQVKTKTRHKWQCPKCSDSLMGKPSLNVICGNCNVTFVDLDAEEFASKNEPGN